MFQSLNPIVLADDFGVIPPSDVAKAGELDYDTDIESPDSFIPDDPEVRTHHMFASICVNHKRDLWKFQKKKYSFLIVRKCCSKSFQFS